MKNLAKNTFRILALAGVFSVATAAKAQSDLPYIGERALPCSVNSPGKSYINLDAGYYADETCSTIYVMPPQLGSLRISPPAYLNTSYCGWIDANQQNIDREKEKLPNLSISEAAEKTNELVHLERSLNSIGRDEAFSVFSFAASLDWKVMIDAYQKANPNLSVVRMPLVTGLLNANLTNPTSQVDEGDKSQLLSLKIFGANYDDQLQSNSAPEINDLVGKLTHGLNLSKTYVFGGAVGGQMSLRLRGTCGLFNEGGKLKAEAESNFVATYTYLYPLQTRSSYTVQLDHNKFDQTIMKIIKDNNGSISDKEIKAAIQENPMISVTLKDGMGAEGEATDLSKEYKEEIKMVVASSIVRTVSNRVTSSVSNAKYFTNEERRERQCSGKWIFKHCWDNVYYVKVKHIDWSSVKSQLQNLLGDGDPGVRKYNVIYLTGTSAFANVK